MVSEITDKINSFFKKLGYIYFMWQYKRHLKKRIEKIILGEEKNGK